jgi:hypothetical protein
LTSELKLNLSSDKTLITNSNKGKALFLGTLISKSRHQTFNRSLGFARRNNREIRLEAPLDRIIKKLREANILDGTVSIPRFI